MRRVVWIAAALFAAATAYGFEDSPRANPSNDGAVFVMTNDPVRNQIVSFVRSADGQLQRGGEYATGGRGSGGTIDPLQSQGSLVLTPNHEWLLAANAGSGTISVFRVRGADLHLESEAFSGGSEPLAITMSGPFVYVLNGAAAGSVVALRWDDGRLHAIPNATVFLSRTSAGGSSISASPDGKFLSVTERLTNNIDILPIQGDGTPGKLVVNNSSAPGVFAAQFAPNGALIVSETGPAGGTNASALSSYAVAGGGTITAISQSVPTLGAANCWNVISPNGKWVYVSNAGSATLSGFNLTGSGALTPIAGTVLAANPTGSTNLDLTISADSRFVYTLNAGAGAIGIFAVQADGSLLEAGSWPGLPAAAGWNGIAAY